jgi:hypothetical protein
MKKKRGAISVVRDNLIEFKYFTASEIGSDNLGGRLCVFKWGGCGSYHMVVGNMKSMPITTNVVSSK